jgi:hypothetical protein
MKGTPMPRVLPTKLASLLSTAAPKGSAKRKKTTKKKIPKGFVLHGEEEEGLYTNASNGWFYNIYTKLYFREKSGPFFVFDAAQRKLVPKK